jgi:hypothetical protein
VGKHLWNISDLFAQFCRGAEAPPLDGKFSLERFESAIMLRR